MTSNDLKMTSNGLKTTSNESVELKKYKLKRGLANDNPTEGKIHIEQAFSSPIYG